MLFKYITYVQNKIVMNEPLLSEEKSRYVVFPIQYEPVWKMYKLSQASYWTAEEISFTQKDLDEWQTLDPKVKHFLEHQLAFFAGSDGIVIENLASRFCNEIAIPEAKCFYTFQMAIEAVHSETYSLLIDTYIRDEGRKQHLFNAIDTIPTIRKKADWALKYISDNESSFATRLIAFAIVEGVFFSGAFASIYYIKEQGILEALTFSNELISRDESLHTEFAVLLFSYIKDKPSQKLVHDMFREAVDVEVEFITDSIPCSLLGLNSEMMATYIQYVADRLLKQMGYSALFNVDQCPLDFMQRISLENKTNFFEARVSDYSKASSKGQLSFSTEDDF